VGVGGGLWGCGVVGFEGCGVVGLRGCGLAGLWGCGVDFGVGWRRGAVLLLLANHPQLQPTNQHPHFNIT